MPNKKHLTSQKDKTIMTEVKRQELELLRIIRNLKFGTIEIVVRQSLPQSITRVREFIIIK